MGECAHVTYRTIFLAEKNNMNKNWMRLKIWRYSEKILYIDMSSAGLVLCYGSKFIFVSSLSFQTIVQDIYIQHFNNILAINVNFSILEWKQEYLVC